MIVKTPTSCKARDISQKQFPGALAMNFFAANIRNVGPAPKARNKFCVNISFASVATNQLVHTEVFFTSAQRTEMFELLSFLSRCSTVVTDHATQYPSIVGWEKWGQNPDIWPVAENGALIRFEYAYVVWYDGGGYQFPVELEAHDE